WMTKTTAWGMTVVVGLRGSGRSVIAFPPAWRAAANRSLGIAKSGVNARIRSFARSGRSSGERDRAVRASTLHGTSVTRRRASMRPCDLVAPLHDGAPHSSLVVHGPHRSLRDD